MALLTDQARLTASGRRSHWDSSQSNQVWHANTEMQSVKIHHSQT